MPHVTAAAFLSQNPPSRSESPAQTWPCDLLWQPGASAHPDELPIQWPLVLPDQLEKFQVSRSSVIWPLYQCSALAAIVVPKTMHTNCRTCLCLVMSSCRIKESIIPLLFDCTERRETLWEDWAAHKVSSGIHFHFGQEQQLTLGSESKLCW